MVWVGISHQVPCEQTRNSLFTSYNMGGQCTCRLVDGCLAMRGGGLNP